MKRYLYIAELILKRLGLQDVLAEEIERLQEEAIRKPPNNLNVSDLFVRRKEKEKQEAHIFQTQRMLVDIQLHDQETSQDQLEMSEIAGDKKRKLPASSTNKAKRLRTNSGISDQDDDFVCSEAADEDQVTEEYQKANSPIPNTSEMNLGVEESALGSPEFSSTHIGAAKNPGSAPKEVPFFKYSAGNFEEDDSIFDF